MQIRVFEVIKLYLTYGRFLRLAFGMRWSSVSFVTSLMVAVHYGRWENGQGHMDMLATMPDYPFALSPVIIFSIFLLIVVSVCTTVSNRSISYNIS